MKARIKICCVSNRHHSPAFSASLAGLMGFSAVQADIFERVGLTMIPWQSCLSLGREQGVQVAQAEGATHILFVDDDMAFPPQALAHLYRKGKRIIGANYVQKQLPVKWVARDGDGEEINTYKMVDKMPMGSQAHRLGFGLILIDLDVFNKIKLPWFTNTWSEERGHMTEDTFFCAKALAAGEEIWVDHHLSMDCRHAGEHLFGPHG